MNILEKIIRSNMEDIPDTNVGGDNDTEEKIRVHIAECLHRIDNIRSFVGSKEYINNDEKCIRNIEVLKTSIAALEEYLSLKKKNSKNGWIPVEERLPSDEIGEVLAQNRQEYMLIGYFSYNENMDWYECESDEALLTDVVAWQPLPEPYQPKEQNNGK